MDVWLTRDIDGSSYLGLDDDQNQFEVYLGT